MDVALLLARLALAAIFVAAAAGKLVDRDATRLAFARFGLPAGVARPAALGLPIAELMIAGGLVVAASASWAAQAATVLLVVFCAAIARVLARGETPDCHCFGGVGAAPVSRKTLARNAVLLAGAGFVAVAGPGAGGGASATAWIADADTLALVFGAAIAGQLVFSWQLLRQNGRLLERVGLLETRGAAIGADDGRALAPGTIAPAFALPDLDGRTVTLEGLLAEGRGALLVFTDPDCGHCEPLLPLLGASSDGPPMAVVSRGSVEQNRAKAAEHGVAPVLLQADFEVADAYRAFGLPAAVRIDPAGRIAGARAQGADDVLEIVRVGAPA